MKEIPNNFRVHIPLNAEVTPLLKLFGAYGHSFWLDSQVEKTVLIARQGLMGKNFLLHDKYIYIDNGLADNTPLFHAVDDIKKIEYIASCPLPPTIGGHPVCINISTNRVTHMDSFDRMSWTTISFLRVLLLFAKHTNSTGRLGHLIPRYANVGVNVESFLQHRDIVEKIVEYARWKEAHDKKNVTEHQEVLPT